MLVASEQAKISSISRGYHARPETSHMGKATMHCHLLAAAHIRNCRKKTSKFWPKLHSFPILSRPRASILQSSHNRRFRLDLSPADPHQVDKGQEIKIKKSDCPACLTNPFGTHAPVGTARAPASGTHSHPDPMGREKKKDRGIRARQKTKDRRDRGSTGLREQRRIWANVR